MTKKFYLIVALLLCLGLANVVLAETITLPNPLCPTDANGQPINPNNCVRDIPALIVKVTDYILTVVGVLATLVFVWAGILFVTAGAFPENLGKAKHALWYGVIGVAITVIGKGLVAVIQGIIGGQPLTFNSMYALADVTIPAVPGSFGSIQEVLNKVLNFIWPLFIGFAVIMFLLAAFEFLMAQGDEAKIKTARYSILYGMIGVALGVLAFSLPYVVINFFR